MEKAKNTANKEAKEVLMEREGGHKISKDLDKIRPIKIIEKIPRFKSIKDLMTFIQENLGIIGEINIKETGQTVSVSKRNIKRD